MTADTDARRRLRERNGVPPPPPRAAFDFTEPPPPTVTYWAISILSSRTFWLNAAALVVTLLSATDVIAIVPLRLLPLAAALVSALNIALRFATVRPVALILPGTTKPVAVAKIDPPPPASVTD
jgi:hypothetical protein